jgi:NAD+ synthase
MHPLRFEGIGMMDNIKLALAQLNPTVGDVSSNAALVREARAEASDNNADLLVLSELFIVGYPPEDLVLKPALLDAAAKAIADLAEQTSDNGPAILIGAPWTESGRLYNAVALLDGGEIKAVRYKHELPNYGVFDEIRLFEAGPLPGPINFRGVRIGAPICEDIWKPDVVECLAETGAEIILTPNGSPFEYDKHDVRMNHVVARIAECGLPIAYVNQVGGQDELVFDGASFAVNGDSSLALQAPAWNSSITYLDANRTAAGWRFEGGSKCVNDEGLAAIYSAAMLGLRDYVNKNRFAGIVIGMSGGIDSALSAAIAVDALGPDRVHCVMMPSKYTSRESLDDASEAAQLMGVRLDSVSIEGAVDAFDEALAPMFQGRVLDTTEENIQSRARGLILMAISNKFGSMVLTTGNKSEMSVGYATLYGDMCGGFNVLKDIYKQQVFALSAWRNENTANGALGPDGPVMPDNIVRKPPTAELREDQKDEDSLPPYEILDDILECLVEREMPVDQIVARGHDLDVVNRIQHLLYIAEYKRRQAPPGVKIGTRNFGRDRRYPITNGFRDKG